MPMSIRMLGPGFVGEVSGIDLTQPLRPDDIAAINAGMDKYRVLIFHGQNFTDEQQLAFTQSLGPLEIAVGFNLRKPGDQRLASPHFADVSNLDKDGQVYKRDDRRWQFAIGNRLWHSDSSFKVVPAKYSLLHARAIPSKGGNTEFADMRQAWESFDQETKDTCEPLICEHSQMFSRAKLGFTEFSEEELPRFKPVLQRLVRVHPSTGKKSIYLSSHAGRIVGWPDPEAKAFLMDLTEMATQREFTYSHKWTVGDLVIWDNQATMHRARPIPHGEPRDVRRTTLMGDAPTVEQQAA
jgi:alpha-ketoglutarate-dependent 2,4-dichlorophenoxyacetate dioxygenase